MSKSAYIYGIQAILEALEHGESIEKLWIDKAAKGPHMNELIHKARTEQVPVQFVPQAALKKYANKNHQGVIALSSPIAYVNYQEMIPRLFEEGKMPLILALDGITDVRNFGALARTALCMGVHFIVIPARGSAIINEDAIKTSAGALFQLPVSRVNNLADCMQYMQDSGLAIVACSEKGNLNCDQSDLNKPMVLILGGEERGISQSVVDLTDEHVKIPMSPALDSLNVSVAGGVLMYEAARQRGFDFSALPST